MRRMEYLAVIMLALGFGLVGGIVSTRLVRPLAGGEMLVKAENFLVGGKYGPCAAFGLNSAGQDLSLSKKGERDRTGLYYGASDGEPQVGLCDTNGVLRVLLGIGLEGSSRLELRDKEGKTRARLLVGPDGKTLLALLDKDGKVVWQAP